ncbi:unnamed protein product [Chironomus riparius]|uniref:Uncharacterized protein n=1 Tax=Chironomus riparius TaxID=315576 RepID=A0A9N9S735_9DIPT|nr:unnamed protein product [Chironomus riparius]
MRKWVMCLAMICVVFHQSSSHFIIPNSLTRRQLTNYQDVTKQRSLDALQKTTNGIVNPRDVLILARQVLDMMIHVTDREDYKRAENIK